MEPTNHREASYTERKQSLLHSLARDRGEMQRALDDLRDAAQAAARRLTLRDRIAAHPLPWAFGALVLGVWFGSRRSGQRAR